MEQEIEVQVTVSYPITFNTSLKVDKDRLEDFDYVEELAGKLKELADHYLEGGCVDSIITSCSIPELEE